MGDPPFTSVAFYEQCMEAYEGLLTHYVRDVASIVPEMDRVVGIDTTADPSRDLLVRLRRTSCGAGCTTLFVDERGDVFPCAAMCTRGAKLGNAFEVSLPEIYHGAAREYRRRVSVENIPQCAACTYRFFCAGGCRANGCRPEDPTATCAFIKGRYDKFFSVITRPVAKQSAAARDAGGPVRSEGELLCGS
jgi:radical SAM protein with 4Fe4S-binding SPASM domain